MPVLTASAYAASVAEFLLVESQGAWADLSNAVGAPDSTEASCSLLSSDPDHPLTPRLEATMGVIALPARAVLTGLTIEVWQRQVRNIVSPAGDGVTYSTAIVGGEVSLEFIPGFPMGGFTFNHVWLVDDQELIEGGTNDNIWILTLAQRLQIEDALRNTGGAVAILRVMGGLEGDDSTAYVDAVRLTAFYFLSGHEAQVI